MHLNIGQKIFGIAAVVLLMMAAVALYSIHLASGISEDLRAIAARHLPASQAAARINIMMLDQGVVLQRLFSLSNDPAQDARTLAADTAHFRKLSVEVAKAFDHTHTILREGGEAVMAEHLSAIEREYKAFETHGWKLFKARETWDRRQFDQLVSALNARQDAINREIANLHGYMADVTDEAVRHADMEERNLLLVNTVLTVLATFMSLFFSAIVTRLLVQAVRELVAGAEAVQAGNLDTEVAITTHDEVGRLSKAFNSMVDGLRLKERIKDTFGKYMDPRIVSGLLEHPEFTNPGGEKREMSVMFIDLKGFTSISEALPPNALVDMVNDFFGHMTDAIASHQGVVDKYMGDAVMAYWGPPFCDAEDHADLACRAAVDALSRLKDFRAAVHAELGAQADGLDIDLRIGVSSGDMIVGTIGSTASRNFTVMGDPVNLGSRLEGANKAYGTRILISERTYQLARDAIAAREIDMIRVKGKHEPVRVYELLSDADSKPSLQNGLKAYRAQDWDTAQAAFSALSGDSAAQVYQDRIQRLRTAPPPADWDGVWVFETK